MYMCLHDFIYCKAKEIKGKGKKKKKKEHTKYNYVLDIYMNIN